MNTSGANKSPVRLTWRQINLMLEALIVLSVATGVISWMVDLRWARLVTVVHAVSGFAMLVLAPMKVRGPVRAGFRRGRITRWLSVVFGVMLLTAIVLGVLHSSGLWYGIGYWSALWTHLLLGFSLVPLTVWHVWSRPVRPGRTDLTRRSLLSGGIVSAVAATTVASQEVVLRLFDLDGSERAGTGSHEFASFEPSEMPVVSWIDDKTPKDGYDDWVVLLDGVQLSVSDIAARSESMPAVLDCTGGWRSEQNWDVVALADLIANGEHRSIRVTSATGYHRLFSKADSDRIFVCTGYDGVPLSRGHGAPLRIVAPGRRGPWWVKWITKVETSDRPAWLQLPFPPT